MAGAILSTASFFGHVSRDLAGSLRGRWVRFYRRVVLGEELATVAVDVYPFFEYMTGVGWYTWNLLAALDRRDDALSYNLYAHTFVGPDEPAPASMPGSERMRLRIHRLPHRFLLPKRATLWLMRRLVEPLLRLLDANDVLFAPNFFIPRSQLPFGRSGVATIHDMAFRVMPRTVAPETLDELERNLPPSMYRVERLIAVSEATAEDAAEHLQISRRRIHTVHEGLDPTFARPPESGVRTDAPQETGPELPGRYLLFVSTLEPRKNVSGILSAFKLLVEWGYSGHLLLVGRWGWRTEALRAQLETSPARHRIRHLEDVTREQLPALYRRADALLFPSWLEGFGLPLLEGMACGVPVVTSGLSAMPEVAGSAAVYVDPASPHGIASAVSSLVEDQQLRTRLIEHGRERASRFSWDRAAAATAQVLRQVAGLRVTAEDEYRV